MSEKTWPCPAISRVIQGKIRIPNLTNEPIYLSRSQHIADVRKVFSDSLDYLPDDLTQTSVSHTSCTEPETQSYHSSNVILDQDGQLSFKERQLFSNTLREYDKAFDPNITTYNDRFGVIRSNVHMGPVLPPPRKGKIPLYNLSKLKILQEEADKLEKLGVLASPADVGIDHVLHVSPSFLLKKPGGHETQYRFVTAFTELGQHVRLPPARSCNDVPTAVFLQVHN